MAARTTPEAVESATEPQDAAQTPPTQDRIGTMIQALAAPFDDVKSRHGAGGREFHYINGNQVIERLSGVFGVPFWSDVVRSSSWDAENRQATVVVEITATWPDGNKTTHAGVGVRSIQGQNVTSDAAAQAKKGAETDALKRAARKFGIGLYLSDDEFIGNQQQGGYQQSNQGGGYQSNGYQNRSNGQGGGGYAPRPQQPPRGNAQGLDGNTPCSNCGEALNSKPADEGLPPGHVRFPDGKVWTPDEIVRWSVEKKYGRVMCMPCHRQKLRDGDPEATAGRQNRQQGGNQQGGGYQQRAPQPQQQPVAATSGGGDDYSDVPF